MLSSGLIGIHIRRKGQLLFAGALFLLVVGVLVLRPGLAQRALIQEQNVTLDVAVIDRDTEAYGSLTKDEFAVYEDGVKQQVISLTAQDAPFSLGIAIDASGSMRAQLPLIQKAAQDVISQMGSSDEAFVMAFTSGSELMQDFTGNQRDLANAVGRIYTSGGTSLLDAVVAASNYVHKKGKNRRKALLFITDGVEKGSSINEDKALTALIENQAQSYFVCLPVQVYRPFIKDKTSLKPVGLLDRLARSTGGQSFYLGGAEQSSPTAEKLIGSLRHQYEVTYASTNNKHGDKMRKVRVVISPKDGRQLNVITRQGYYGPDHKRVSEQGMDKEKG